MFLNVGDRWGLGFQRNGDFRLGKLDGIEVMGMPFGVDDGIRLGTTGFGFGKRHRYGPISWGDGMDIDWGQLLPRLLVGLLGLGQTATQ